MLFRSISSTINGTKPVINAALNGTFEIAIIQNVPIRSSVIADNIAIIIKYSLLCLLAQSMGTSAEIIRNPMLYPPYCPVIYPSPATPPTKTGIPAIPRSSHIRIIVNDCLTGNVRIIIVIIKVNAVICVPFGKGILMYADTHNTAANIDIITRFRVEILLFVLDFSIFAPFLQCISRLKFIKRSHWHVIQPVQVYTDLAGLVYAILYISGFYLSTLKNIG